MIDYLIVFFLSDSNDQRNDEKRRRIREKCEPFEKTSNRIKRASTNREREKSKNKFSNILKAYRQCLNVFHYLQAQGHNSRLRSRKVRIAKTAHTSLSRPRRRNESATQKSGM